MSARVLVTGATGFVGAHVARHLVGRGDDVHVLCRSTSDERRLDDLRHDVTRHDADLRDTAAVRDVVARARPARVFHLAAAAMHAGRSPAPDEQVGTNVGGTVALMDACAELGIEAFVNVGDAFEYGPADGPVAEAAPCRPTSLDGITKLAATLYGTALAGAGRLPVVTVRPFSVVGPHDDPHRLVPRLLDAARTGTTMPLSDRHVVRDFVWIDDVVGLCVLVADRAPALAGAVCNGGSGVATTLGDLISTVEAVTGRTIDAAWGAFPVAPHDRAHPVADTTATSALGWCATTSLATMVSRLSVGIGGSQASDAADPRS